MYQFTLSVHSIYIFNTTGNTVACTDRFLRKLKVHMSLQARRVVDSSLLRTLGCLSLYESEIVNVNIPFVIPTR